MNSAPADRASEGMNGFEASLSYKLAQGLLTLNRVDMKELWSDFFKGREIPVRIYQCNKHKVLCREMHIEH